MAGWNAHQKAVVKAIYDDLIWMTKHEWLEDYVSARPYQQPTRHQVIVDGHHFSNDCSGTIKLIVCGWHHVVPFDGDPNGYGSTRTFANGPRVYHVAGGPGHWQELDILLYKEHIGPFHGGADEHATILTRKINGTWNCFTMGGDHDPAERKWNYRNDLGMVIRFPIPLK